MPELSKQVGYCHHRDGTDSCGHPENVPYDVKCNFHKPAPDDCPYRRRRESSASPEKP